MHQYGLATVTPPLCVFACACSSNRLCEVRVGEVGLLNETHGRRARSIGRGIALGCEETARQRLDLLEPCALELRDLFLDPRRGGCAPAWGDGLLDGPRRPAM
jgi:hypothetical protein